MRLDKYRWKYFDISNPEQDNFASIEAVVSTENLKYMFAVNYVS